MMILKIKYNIRGDSDDQRGQIYDKLDGLLSIFYVNPVYSLDYVTVNISYLFPHPSDGGDRRYSKYVLKTQIHSGEDIKMIIYYIEEFCRVRGIAFEDVDRIYVGAKIGKIHTPYSQWHLDKPVLQIVICRLGRGAQ